MQINIKKEEMEQVTELPIDKYNLYPYFLKIKIIEQKIINNEVKLPLLIKAKFLDDSNIELDDTGFNYYLSVEQLMNRAVKNLTFQVERDGGIRYLYRSGTELEYVVLDYKFSKDVYYTKNEGEIESLKKELREFKPILMNSIFKTFGQYNYEETLI